MNRIRLTRTLERRLILTGSIIALITLLLYTGVHTASVLTRYIDPPIIGYVCALGIELTIALIAWRLGRKIAGEKVPTFLFPALVIALVISALANLDEGYRVNYGESFQIANLSELDWFQAIVWVAVTLLVPVMVFAFMEIVGSELKEETREDEQEFIKVQFNNAGFIYVLQREDGIYKLGRTTDIKRRINQLEQDYQMKFAIVHVFVVPNMDAYENLALEMTAQYHYDEDERLELRQMTQDQLNDFLDSFSEHCSEHRVPVQSIDSKSWGVRELAKAAGIAPATASKVTQVLNGK